MRKALSIFIAVCLALSLFTGGITPTPSARADTSGDFTYSLVGTAPNQTATITGYAGPGGVVAIPATLGTSPAYSVTSIGAGAFQGCSSLASVTIPNSVTSIGDGAFQLCSALISVTIPNSVTSIGNGVFWGCSSVTSVTIPNSVTSIGDYAFIGCSSLTIFIVDPGNPSYSSSADGVLFNKTATLLIQYPAGKQGAYVIPNSVTGIGNGAFWGCSSLASVTIPNSVTSIGDYAFNGCSGLTGVTIGSGVTSIGKWAFEDCSSLTSVTIPDSVTSIGVQAFLYCWSLTSVTIPDSVTSIGGYAFGGCSSLTSAYFLGNAPTMGGSVFASCATGFTVWYLCGKTGWTDPWYGYPTDNNCSTATDLVLSSSWNLISVAVSLPVASITGLQSIYGYHNGWSVPTTLTPGEGYWVQVQNAVTIPVPGTPSTVPVPLTYQAGWQLLGNPFDVPLPISSITNHAYITTCYSYGPAWGVLNPATGSLQPGKGYWILLSASTTLTLTHP